MEQHPLRIVLAKVGLDGHDRGIKVVARALRDAGMHVIYAGLWQTPEAVARTVAEEDADWLGLSLLSGAHMTLVPRVMEVMRANHLEQVNVMVGGIIPEADIPRLQAMGVAQVFGPGTSLDDIVSFCGAARPAMLDDLFERFARKDRLALSRLLSLAARGVSGPELARRLPPVTRPSRVVAFTGSGGVGKSTLIGKMIDTIRRHEKSVAVLACDPQSSVSGGALLGDRFRMGSRLDDDVFIRSLAALSGHGAVADHLDLMCRLLEAFGFDVIVLETVGAGQGDVAVRNQADVVVLLLQPETGDDLQWEKAGVLEVADIVVIHKGDLPGADHVVAQVKAALELSHVGLVPVLKVSAKAELGLEELWQAMEACPLRSRADDCVRRELLQLVQDTVAHRFQNFRNDAELTRLADGWRQGAITGGDVAEAIIKLLAR